MCVTCFNSSVAVDITVWSDAAGPEWTHGQVLIGGSRVKAGVTHRVVEHEWWKIQGEAGPPSAASSSSSSSSLAVPSGRSERGGRQAALWLQVQIVVDLLEDSHLRGKRHETSSDVSCFQSHCFVLKAKWKEEKPVLFWSAPLYLADSDDEDREDEDSQGHPGHVGFEAPGLSKVSPTLIDTRSHFWAGEDENLEEQTGVWVSQNIFPHGF